MTPAGVHARKPAHEQAEAFRVEPVDVFGGHDALDDRLGIQVVRQRHLHEDAVHGGIGVQRIDERVELSLRRGRRQSVIEAPDAHLFAVALLHSHVARRGGIIADEHHSETRRHAARLKFAYPHSRALADRRRHLHAIDDRRHALSAPALSCPRRRRPGPTR